jgi:hypothetical protein
MWSLVLYSLTILAGGVPWAATFHPQENEAACRALEVSSREELRKAGFIGRCQFFEPGKTPRWP